MGDLFPHIRIFLCNKKEGNKRKKGGGEESIKNGNWQKMSNFGIKLTKNILDFYVYHNMSFKKLLKIVSSRKQ